VKLRFINLANVSWPEPSPARNTALFFSAVLKTKYERNNKAFHKSDVLILALSFTHYHQSSLHNNSKLSLVYGSCLNPIWPTYSDC
jgi:hypothetical protein